MESGESRNAARALLVFCAIVYYPCLEGLCDKYHTFLKQVLQMTANLILCTHVLSVLNQRFYLQVHSKRAKKVWNCRKAGLH